MKRRFTRRERRQLFAGLQKTLDSTKMSVSLLADRTEKSVPLDPTSPENIEHWMKYSYGSWRKER